MGYVVDSANRAQAARWNASNALTVLSVPGATSAVAFDINDSGAATGTAYINGVDTAVMWDRAGNATVLGEGSGRYITNAGTVIGYSGNQPARWTDGGGLYVYDNPGATLLGHNEAANAVGRLGDEGVLWLGRRRAPLGTGTTPHDLSDNGWAVGTSGTQAVRWKAEEFTVAEPLAPSPSTATEINNAGLIGGTVGSWAVTWSASGTQTQLPVLPGATRSRVSGLSEDNQVIGIVGFADGNWHAVVWR